mmetsp:Transcript_29449/g.62054  ORF Transcript_29449/g.62054 Transcript_29449/m.62054 type:complete len:103 (+) Transcript_29449:26-334(+)
MSLERGVITLYYILVALSSRRRKMDFKMSRIVEQCPSPSVNTKHGSISLHPNLDFLLGGGCGTPTPSPAMAALAGGLPKLAAPAPPPFSGLSPRTASLYLLK